MFRKLEDWKKTRRPVVLFVDEAQDLNGNTLNGLKRLMEVVEDGGGLLSVVLVGQPRLRYGLGRPTMEEIGYRTDVFDFEGVAGVQRPYIEWLLDNCSQRDVEPDSILTEAAVDVFAEKLRTPLQIQWHLTRALEAGYEAGEKPVSVMVVESVLSRQLDDLEPTLKRLGFGVRDLAEQIDAKPTEIRALFDNQLDPTCATGCWPPACPSEDRCTA
ncbi:AAA family ATPase [Paraburkholderia dinghuensis]|uniref:AAA family ATPase n=1 Tax=Paraburkholderia dinghuensis TaxID=2305225 RepID=UPI001FE7A8CF|nr:AAA family ATPase [Paraburkholderia dinghuensis]